MHSFQYKGTSLFCENISVSEIAHEINTPFYLYSYQTLCNHYDAFDIPLKPIPHLICYSMKANSNLAVLKTFLKKGSGLDIVSGGELYRAIKVGADPEKIVYSGIGKKKEEIQYALKIGILMFNVESEQELYLINEIANSFGVIAPISIRVNPDIDPHTHPYISTGLKKNKFGVDIDNALELYKIAKNMDYIKIIGVDYHIGSQLIEMDPFINALEKVKSFVKKLESLEINIKYLDLGGGLGITYEDEEPPHPKEYANKIIKLIKDIDCLIIFEPGRVLVGNAGILVSKVLYIKKKENKTFIIIDAAMNDLIRPSLYQAYHKIIPINNNYKEVLKADIVGPVCESGDFIALDREVPKLNQGDLIAIMGTGAYGFTMSSNYNSRPRIPEVMVNGDEYFIIRSRETYNDLIRGENIPQFLLD